MSAASRRESIASSQLDRCARPVADAASKGDTDMIKLALVIGHTEQRQGAFGVSPIGANEYSWNKDLAQMMAAHLEDMDDVEAKSFFRDDVGIVGAYDAAKDWGADAAIELHFNSAGPTATGSETLFVTAVSRPLAEAVQDATVTTLGLRDRGVKTPNEASGGRGTRNLSQMGPKPSILTEPFFGSNAGDATAASERKSALARAQVEAAVNVLRSIDAEDVWTVSASSLNVRGGPGIEFEKLAWGLLENGVSVELISRQGDWALIRASGGEGFVHTAFLA